MAEDIRDLAIAWLEQGLDAPHLGELAGERNSNLSDITPLFERVLRELGAEGDLSRESARLAAMRVLLSRVVEAENDTAGWVWAALQPFYFTGEGPELNELGALYWEADDPILSGRRLSSIEKDMREEAGRILAQIEEATS